MPKSPPSPSERPSVNGEWVRDRLRSAEPGRRDELTELQSNEGGDAGMQLERPRQP